MSDRIREIEAKTTAAIQKLGMTPPLADLRYLLDRLAALEADKERLDWLENKEGRPGGIQSVCWNGPNGRIRGYSYSEGKVPCRLVDLTNSVRECIDASIAGAARQSGESADQEGGE